MSHFEERSATFLCSLSSVRQFHTEQTPSGTLKSWHHATCVPRFCRESLCNCVRLWLRMWVSQQTKAVVTPHQNLAFLSSDRKCPSRTLRFPLPALTSSPLLLSKITLDLIYKQRPAVSTTRGVEQTVSVLRHEVVRHLLRPQHNWITVCVCVCGSVHFNMILE